MLYEVITMDLAPWARLKIESERQKWKLLPETPQNPAAILISQVVKNSYNFV